MAATVSYGSPLDMAKAFAINCIHVRLQAWQYRSPRLRAVLCNRNVTSTLSHGFSCHNYHIAGNFSCGQSFVPRGLISDFHIRFEL